MDGLRYWIETEGKGHWFFLAFPICLLFLLIWFKGRRVRFLIPALIISIIFINPWFYQKWEEMGLYAYWRILWVVPVIPIIAALAPSFTEKVKKLIFRTIIAGVSIALIVFGGTFLYAGAGGTFVQAENDAKLPNYVVGIADRLLELNDHPRIIAQYPIGTYIRQYSGAIDILFGRDIDRYMIAANAEARTIYNQVENGDIEPVAQYMLDNGYDFLVYKGQLEDYMELVDTVGDYGIYSAIGRPKVVKQRNELGQIIAINYIDEQGNPQNNNYGYSTVSYEYDKNGLLIREFRTNVDGFGVADSRGRAGYEKEYDESTHVIKEKYIGSDGKAVRNREGYAEYRREYNDNMLIKESYYDEYGHLINRIDTGYAIVKIEYSRDNTVAFERYFDSDLKPVCTALGYARLKKETIDNRIIRESYYNLEGQPCIIPDGYSCICQTYDENQRIVLIEYYDTGNQLVDCVNGYAKEEREYDEKGNMVLQRFYNSKNEPEIAPIGYAEVHIDYDGANIICEKYYGTDGEPLEKAAGYAAISQIWDESNLISRTYLGVNDEPINRVDGYSQAIWELSDEGSTWEVRFINLAGQTVNIDDLNLAKDIKNDSDGWSEWMTPRPNMPNSTFNIGNVNLGEKTEGDIYTCKLEIEFKNVVASAGQSFSFSAQGEQDGQWFTGNVWSGDLLYLSSAPNDGIYTYLSTTTITDSMVKVSTFNLGFRCDYWASGSFRVRNVTVQKGDKINGWKPGL